MKVTMKIKVYALMMMTVAMAGNVVMDEMGTIEAMLQDNEVILAEVGDGEDEGWFAEEFNDKLLVF